jgi:TetR/AcrR family transcriptional regulator, tetracycline repressor protein
MTESRSRASLSRDLVVTVALRALDRDGPDKFTMRGLGRELGADPMAVYHYFPSKAELFDGVLDSLYEQIVLPDPLPASGTEALRVFAQVIYDGARTHPRLLPIMATRPIGSPAVFRQIESVAQRLVASGAQPADALVMVNIAMFFAIGTLLAEVGEPVGGPERDVMRDMGGIDPAEFPTMMAAMAVHDEPGAFDFFGTGLDALIAGLGSRYGLTAST